ncbi:hypothetical protein [Streptomyces sp. NPDC058657]|uniref:hypothetical protein n=1 Tax=unclassified Streptomyces TaxID=2593676 RepID=UPI003659FB60
MTGQGRTHAPSVRQLHALIDTVEADVSASRLRQLRMVADMFGRAVGREELPARAERTVAQLFTWAALPPFWELAVAGELAEDGRSSGVPMPLATQRIVRDCLARLAELAVPDKKVSLPQVPQSAARATVPAEQLVPLYRRLVEMAGIGPLDRQGVGLSFEDRTRLLAMVAVVLDTGSRSGELERQRMSDLADGEKALRVERRPQNATHLPALERVWPLRNGTQVALRRWLEVREKLVYGVDGGREALWVTLVASPAGPKGISIRGQGIRKAYARGMAALNWVMAGEFGWEPLPLTLEQLSRTVRAELGEVRPPREKPPGRPVGRPRLPEDRPLEHGKPSTYKHRGCRCAECRESVANLRRAYRRQAAAREAERRERRARRGGR